MSSRFLANLLRLSAVFLTLLTLAVFLLRLNEARVAAGALAGLVLMCAGAIGVALALAALAHGLARREDDNAGLFRTISRVQHQLDDVRERLADQAVSLDRLHRARAPAAAGHDPASSGAAHAPPPGPPRPLVAQLAPGALDPLHKLLEEVRDIALLTDAERGERLSRMHHERKLLLVRQALEHIERQHFAGAAAQLERLESQYPNDFDIRRARQQFEDARRNAEPVTVETTCARIEQLVAISSFEQAEHMARGLTADFPGNIDARNKLARVIRERDTFRETTVARMLDEIRHDIDRRLWRRALLHAQRLLEKHSDHPKTQRLREQLPTIRDNAEIEERQEQEVQIQELIRSRKFNDAIQLSEDLVHRFPDSPQAEAIETLLPRIRELAREEEAEPSPAP